MRRLLDFALGGDGTVSTGARDDACVRECRRLPRGTHRERGVYLYRPPSKPEVDASADADADADADAGNAHDGLSPWKRRLVVSWDVGIPGERALRHLNAKVVACAQPDGDLAWQHGGYVCELPDGTTKEPWSGWVDGTITIEGVEKPAYAYALRIDSPTELRGNVRVRGRTEETTWPTSRRVDQCVTN